MRVCLGCGLSKNICQFSRDRTLRTGFKARCKSCLAEARRAYRTKHRERYLSVQRAYRKTEKYKQIRRRYESSEKGRQVISNYRRNSPKAKERFRRYKQSQKFRDWRNLYLKKPHVKLRESIRNRLRSALHGNYKKGMGVEYLGCSITELKQYLESLFSPGMSWENHGERHIDHIKPLSSVDLSDPKNLSIVCHYTNLQPLWREANLKKSNKYEIPN